ncbi:MAG: DUF4129 domain-containing protein [Pseudopedobacter sp.]|nr:DUF4129 domain-containing protein [Deinococcales bacterium]
MTLFKRFFPSPLEPILALILPFAWFGGLGSTPWWVLPLWMVALVLRRFDTAHRFVGIPLLVLIAFGMALAFYPDPWGMVTEFFKLFIVGIGLYLAHGSLLEGSAFGLVPLGIMLIFHPHPLGLGALLIGLIALGETSMRGGGKIRSGRALPLLLGGVLSLVVLSALLPRAGLTLEAPPRGESAQNEVETPPTEPTELSTPQEGSARGPITYNLPASEDPVPNWVKEIIKATLSLIMVACVVLFCIILWKPVRLSAGPRVKPWHFIFLGSVFAFSAMLMLYLGLSTGNTLGGSGLSGGSSLPDTGPSSIVNLNANSPEVRAYTFISYILLFALPLLLAFLAYGAWTLWQLRPQQLAAATLPAPAEVVLEPGVIPPLNPDTVRALYARFLEHMGQRGLLRLESETPWEFWRTVSKTYPELEDDAHALTWAYMPVRYGNLPDREGFEAAFRALEHLESVPVSVDESNEES